MSDMQIRLRVADEVTYGDAVRLAHMIEQIWPERIDGWSVYAPDADTERPTATCGCGFQLVWVEGRWEHDAAPSLWGNDHPAEAPEPTGPARDYWDAEDGVLELYDPYGGQKHRYYEDN